MTLPFPNAYSHPIPRFAYDPSTGHLHVRFACDPAYPPPSASPSVKWRERQYLATSIPMRKPRTLIDNAAQFFSSTASRLVARPETSPTADVGEFDLRDDEVMEEERGEEGDVDDSPEHRRDIRVLSLPLATKEGAINGGGSRAARERRRWEIVPILRERTKLAPRSSLTS